MSKKSESGYVYIHYMRQIEIARREINYTYIYYALYAYPYFYMINYHVISSRERIQII